MDSNVKLTIKEKKAPRMTIVRASLLGLMRQYLSAAMDPFVSLLEIHKLMYFMQEAGENLKLHYAKGSHGPYAENLRHVLIHIEGHFIIGYGDAEDHLDKQIEVLPEAFEQAEVFLKNHLDTHERFDRVVDLIEGFETPFGMELLTTVHWVSVREEAVNLGEVVGKTYSWNDRKRMFQKEHIQIAWDVLHRKGWLR